MLPDARKDGYCVDCLEKPAVTNDNRFCKKCVSKRIYEANPDYKTTSDQKFRPARSSQVLGGSSDMRTTENIDNSEVRKLWHGQKQ